MSIPPWRAEESIKRLHNNPAELGPRQRVRERDLRLAVHTSEDVAAGDTLQSIAETAKKWRQL